MTAQLLTGVRVLDLTNVLAGPFATYQLALMGAEVTKVETPGSGDLARSLGADPELNSRGLGISFLAQNAQKRSVTVNLKTPGGQELFEKLVANSDVLCENFRPGVLERLGFGYERLQELNPRLIYCAISGFGQTGPMAEWPAYDQIIQGLSGMMSVTGDADSAPLRAGYPITDSIGGIAAAFAISAGLVSRERTGRGCAIDVSMLETAVTAMGWVVSNHLIGGISPSPIGNDNSTAAPSGTFQTADGALNIAANKQEQFEQLCRTLDRTDLIDDERFCEREARKRNRSALTEELELELARASAQEWANTLSVAGVPAAPVLNVTQMLASEQIVDRELVHQLPFPDGSAAAIHILGSGIRINGAVTAPDSAPPLLGQHTDQVLTELGYPAAARQKLREHGAI